MLEAMEVCLDSEQRIDVLSFDVEVFFVRLVGLADPTTDTAAKI